MTKKYEDYYNDPDIVNEPEPLREIHAIRLMIQDRDKGLSPEEHAARVNAREGEVLKKLGLSHLMVSSAN